MRDEEYERMMHPRPDEFRHPPATQPVTRRFRINYRNRHSDAADGDSFVTLTSYSDFVFAIVRVPLAVVYFNIDSRGPGFEVQSHEHSRLVAADKFCWQRVAIVLSGCEVPHPNMGLRQRGRNLRRKAGD